MAQEVWCAHIRVLLINYPTHESRLFLGNLVYADLMGMPVFIISEREVAEELLNVRGRISAGRPPNVLGQELYVASQHINSLLSHV